MKALILKNLQNDFLPTGAVPLEDTEALILEANKEMKNYEIVIAIQKWYPANHKSFAANHLWRKPGQTITVEDGEEKEEVLLQIIHCVADSFGAAFAKDLNLEKVNYIIKDEGMGSYSILKEINRIVEEHKVEEIDVLGPEEPETRSEE